MTSETAKFTTHRTSGYYRNEFDIIAPFYDPMIRFFAFFFGGEEKLRKNALNLIPVRVGSRIMDIGCGTGTTALLLSEKVMDEGRVIGIDLSLRMLQIAREKTGDGRVLLFRGNAEEVPCPDGTFDFVTIFFVLHEMIREGRQNALREIHRILRPGGKALICDYHHPDNGLGRLLLRLFLLVERKTAKDMVRKGLFSEVQKAGFSASSQRLSAGGLIQLVLLVK